jgi:hypothetical protein
VATNSKTARPKKPVPKAAAATKPVAATPLKVATGAVKLAAAKPKTPKLVDPNHCPFNPLEEISDLLDHLPLQACVELTRRLLTAISTLPTGAARPRAVLKTVILFVAEYGSTP